MNTPDRIYLIDSGDEITWCADPAPGEGMRAEDAVRYLKADTCIPGLDRLEDRLGQGCTIGYQDGRWHLFEAGGESATSGRTIRELIINLIFTDC